MTDEELMDALGETARERELDPRWEKLAAGELTDDELAELRADAGDEADALEAAFAPLDDDDQAGFLDAILGAPSEVGEPSSEVAEAVPVRSEAPARSSGAAARTGSRRGFVVGAAAIALAAGIALFVWLPQSTPELPEYAASVHGGAQTQRGAEGEAGGRFRAEDRVELRLRPSTETSIPVHAAVFRTSGAGEPERLNLPIDVAASGAVRLTALASELLPEPGEHTLTIVVAPARRPIEGIDTVHATQVRFVLVRDDQP
ncbi:MAG: twin-arginine translocation signal domain-containing protein [Deltaproteobacteria bacterium]|nr:twin-arginine translocation signal domain-containing protein [Deltaproteobacteria bacterium]